MSGYVVLITGAADGTPTPHDGRYLVAWNPHTEYGALELTSTDRRIEAYRFFRPVEVLFQWQMVSNVEPWRPDGQPNRPLTGITIQVVPHDP
jgi:hypothetical protein